MTGVPVETPTDVVDHLGGHSLGQWGVHPQLSRVAGVDIAGETVYLRLGETKRFRHISQHRPGPIGDDIGHHRRPLPPVLAIAILDYLFTAVGLEVDIDIRGLAPLLGEESLEGKMEPDRIDPGQSDTPTHRRVGPRPPDLAIDVLITGKIDQVLDHQEVAGELESLDDVQLVLKPTPGLRVDTVVGPRVHVPCSLPGEMTEIVHLVAEVFRHREVGQPRGNQTKIKGEPSSHLAGSSNHARVTSKSVGHLLGVFQIPLVAGRPESVGLSQSPASPDGGKHFGEIGVSTIVIMNLVGCHRGQTQLLGHLPHQIVALVVLGHPVMPQLHVQTGTEQLPEP